MLALNAPNSKGLYVVVKPFRFGGREFIPGMEFDARRQDPTPWRLNELYRDGSLSLPDRKADAAFRKERQKAMKTWKEPAAVKPPAPPASPAAPVLPPASDAQLRALESMVAGQAPVEPQLEQLPLESHDHEE